MSNPFRDAVSAMINDRVGDTSNKMITGIVTHVDNSRGWCTICPVDVEAIWGVIQYYRKTTVDRSSLQGLVERVRINGVEGVMSVSVAIGDKVTVGYNEDVPYVIQRISQSEQTSIANKNLKITQNGSEVSLYDWLGGTEDGIYDSLSDPLDMNAEGDS